MKATILKCVCGKTLEVIPTRRSDIAAVAAAQDWKFLDTHAALCPTCHAADDAVKKHHVEIATQ